MGINIPPNINDKIETLCSLIYKRTKVSLRLPNTGFDYPKNMKIISSIDVPLFSSYLNEEYQKRLKTNIKKIGIAI